MMRENQSQTTPSKPPPKEVEEDGESDEPPEHTAGTFTERPRTYAGFDQEYDSEPDYTGQCASSEGNSQELPEIDEKKFLPVF